MPMSWEEVMRRVRGGEVMEHVLDEMHAIEEAEFRAFLPTLGERGVDALAHYDIRTRNLNTGLWGARSAWASISNAQRAVMLAVVAGRPGRIVRRSVKPSVYTLDGTDALLCRIKTLRNLCERDLMAWDGGAFDPEAAAVITERGAFVVVHGPREDGKHWSDL